MDDLISRQAAIDAVAKGLKGVFVEYQDVAEKLLNNLPSAQPEPCEDAVSRNLVLTEVKSGMIRTIDGENWKRVGDNVRDIKAMPSVTPKQRTGKWILDRSGAYCCSECMEPCASYVMMKPRDKYCKMCGSRNEVTE